MEFLFGTWHWFISGLIIGFVMLALTYFGKTFGMSSNLRTLCSMTPAKNQSDYFNFNWRDQFWNLSVVIGSILGGFFAYYFLMDENSVLEISEATIKKLAENHIDYTKAKLGPEVIFNIENLFSWKSILILLGGGFLIGFGTPYAGGCTSGHAISGLSNLQLPSLIAVVGFFVGGLISAHFLIPLFFR